MKQTLHSHVEDCVVRYQGFHPSEFTRGYLYDKMNALLDEAPYGSIMLANFSRQGPEFKGVVNINSAAGRFFAIARGRRLKWVTHKLVDQIRRQLDRWKAQRFDGNKEVQNDSNHVA